MNAHRPDPDMNDTAGQGFGPHEVLLGALIFIGLMLGIALLIARFS